jgi:hypothetical protein
MVDGLNDKHRANDRQIMNGVVKFLPFAATNIEDMPTLMAAMRRHPRQG